jgi:ribokinase
MDFVAEVPHIPTMGETIQADDFSVFPGGKGANQAVAAARLGGSVAMVGCIGNDEHGEQLSKKLSREDIDITYLKESNQFKTGLAMIGVDKQGNNSIITYPGANEDLTLEDVAAAEELFAKAKLVNLHWDVKQEVGEKFITVAHENNVEIILNLAPVKPITDKTLKLVDVLIVNEIEARMLTDIEVIDFETARKAALKLRNKGLKKVIITLGGTGVFLAAHQLERELLVPKVEVVDTTAAGDTFVGAFTRYYLENSFSKAVEMASKTASLAVTKPGAISSIPTKEEADVFLTNN